MGENGGCAQSVNHFPMENSCFLKCGSYLNGEPTKCGSIYAGKKITHTWIMKTF